MAPSRGGLRGSQTAAKGPGVSTRKLIIAALITGMVILVAFSVQVIMTLH